MNAAPHRSLRNGEGGAFFLQAHDHVAFVADPDKISVVDPFPLQEFERRHRLGADPEKEEPARDFIIVVRKRVRVVRRSVSGAAPDNAVEIHVREHRHLGIAWIHPAHVAAKWRLPAVRIFRVTEVVVSLRICTERGVVLVWRERQWRAAAPATNKLRRE